MIRTTMILAASFNFLIFSQSADKSKEGPVDLERKLHGVWKGPACGGTWSVRADGTFAVEHYSPGNNKLTGTWKVRWNALPPTLVLTFKTSDAPERLKVGETWEVKLIQLDDESLTYEWPQNPGHSTRWSRVKK